MLLAGPRRLAALIVAAFVALVSAGGPAVAAPADDLKTAAIKVAFVYNFAKFVSWPPARFRGADDSLVFCVQRGDLHREALASLEDKQIGERPVSLSLQRPGDSLDGCHVLFASAFASAGGLDTILEVGRRVGILLVSDLPDFAMLGGHIGLVEEGGRLRFQVNLRSVAQAELRLSSQLLQLAEIVEPTRN